MLAKLIIADNGGQAAADIVGLLGDSRTTNTTAGDATTLPRCWVPIKAACDAAFAATVSKTRVSIPFVNLGVDGTTVQAQAPLIAANVALFKITKLITYLGINDIRGGRTLAQIKADFATLCTNAFGAGLLQMLVIPCDFFGELWSVGDVGNPNANDAAIKAVLAPATGLPATLAAHANAAQICYLDNRAAFFNVFEPVHNAPAPGVATRILTQDVAGATSGLHQNPKGVALQAPTWLGSIHFLRTS